MPRKRRRLVVCCVIQRIPGHAGWVGWLAMGAVGLFLAADGCRERASCPHCDTLVISAAGEPDALLPPLVGETVGRDVSDLIFDRLAELRAGGSPLDSTAYDARLAARWDRVDSVTLRFHLRSGARWHDGPAVRAADVAFSFDAYADSVVDSQARPTLAGRVTASAADDSTVLIHFRAPDPEQWYDATWHVRIIPRHIWDSIPRARWADDTAASHLVGSGPFRLTARTKGQSLTLERVGGEGGGPVVRRVIWRFTGDQDAAMNLLLSHEADLLESIGDSARVARVAADSALAIIPYPSAVYGFLGFNLAEGGRGPAQPREVRRALSRATDRTTAARAIFGPGAVAPPGPMSRNLWINDPAIVAASFDASEAARLLDAAGWTRAANGIRQKAGRPLAVDILVPGSSIARRNLAQVVQEMWRRAGVKATVTTVDFPVFQERLRTGRFESFIGAWLDEPSPRSLGPQWTSAGIGVLNYTHYRNPAFDRLYRQASDFRGSPAAALAAWREALDTLNSDAPAIWLYTPMNVAGVARRLEGVKINPYSWLAGLGSWSLRP
jgi:peptide/nickel transport system substrate-binding protein